MTSVTFTWPLACLPSGVLLPLFSLFRLSLFLSLVLLNVYLLVLLRQGIPARGKLSGELFLVWGAASLVEVVCDGCLTLLLTELQEGVVGPLRRGCVTLNPLSLHLQLSPSVKGWARASWSPQCWKAGGLWQCEGLLIFLNGNGERERPVVVPPPVQLLHKELAFPSEAAHHLLHQVHSVHQHLIFLLHPSAPPQDGVVLLVVLVVRAVFRRREGCPQASGVAHVLAAAKHDELG